MKISPAEKRDRLKRMLSKIAPVKNNLETLVREPNATRAALESLDEPTAMAGTELANAGLRSLAADAEPSDEQMNALEAIVLPRERPVVFIQNDDYQTPPEPWGHFNGADIRQRIKAAIPSIGRVELPSQTLVPYAGTAFIVGPNLLMTNRHVAEEFANGLGQRDLTFKPGQTAAWDFKQEYQQPSSEDTLLKVEKVVMIHPFWDMALLQVAGFPAGHAMLKLSVAHPEDLLGKDVAVIGYPAKDWRTNLQLQDQIFLSVYNVKRLQPGKIQHVDSIDSFDHQVRAMTHDSSTLGGNSGSALIDVDTGQVVGLHFAGIYLKANYAVPTFELARDQRVVDARLNFVAPVARDGTWTSYWDNLDGGERPGTPPTDAGGITQSVPSPQRIPLAAANAVTISGVLNISIDLGRIRPSVNGGSESAAGIPLEKITIDSDYSNREGYDAKFLGGRDKLVPLPQLTTLRQRKSAVVNDGNGDGNFEFRYHHFSIVMNGDRRLAYFTAVNIDGGQSKRPKREPDRWIFDPRLPAEMQIGNEFYGKPFDRGHLVRRLDPAWGRTAAVIKIANDDTFHFTNCSPQHARFNEGKNLWAGLEDFILESADNDESKVTVFTGPVFANDDPVYQEVHIPREFWKVVVFVKSDGKLSATGYIVSQADLLKAESIERPADVAKLFQVSVRTVAQRTKLDFGALSEHDPLQGRVATEAVAIEKPLQGFEEIVF